MKRVLLGNDGTGWVGFRASRPGFDASELEPTDYSDLVFDSEWDRIEQIHVMGTLNCIQNIPGQANPYEFWVYKFPALPYVPMITVRRRVSGATRSDEWYTEAAGGEDPHWTIFSVCPYADRFHFASDPMSARSNPALSGVIDYIVWKLPLRT